MKAVGLRGGTVLDPTKGESVTADVLVADGLIQAVGDEISWPSNCLDVDVAGLTVLPGLIDIHTHLTHGYDGVHSDSVTAQTVQAVRNLLRALRAGVTTAREIGSYRQVDLTVRAGVERGTIPGPTLICAGSYITITGGHGYPKGRQADGPDEVRKAAREQLLAGADFLKIMCSGGAARPDESPNAMQFSYAEIEAAAEEATAAGVALAAHAHPRRAIQAAVTAGATSIEHGTYLDQETMSMMRERGTFLVPTLAVYEHIATSGRWPELSERAAELLAIKVDTFAEAVRAGVSWGVGTDASAYFPIEDFASELVLIERHSDADATEVLRAATTGNAALLGRPGLGSLEPGSPADIVVVDGNPLDDLRSVRDVQVTVKTGICFDWRILDAVYGFLST